MYTYVLIYIYIYGHIYAYMHMDVCTCIYIYIYAQTESHTQDKLNAAHKTLIRTEANFGKTQARAAASLFSIVPD